MLSIIIINYKTPQLTLQCVESIVATTKSAYEIIVVDNNSGDNSQQVVTQSYPQVVWINNHSNEGFGRANNLGAAHAKGEYILLLNSDIVVTNNTIDSCLEKMMENSNIGFLSCTLKNNDGSIANSTYTDIVSVARLLNLNVVLYKLHGKFEVKPETTAYMGAFLMFSKDVYNKAGGFDPDYFMYFEELDLCNRIIKLGYSPYFNNDTFAYHKHGASFSNQTKRLKQIYASQALIVYKHKGILHYLLYHTIMHFNIATNAVVSLFVRKYWKRTSTDIKAYFLNYFTYYKIPFLYSRKIGTHKRLLKVI